MSLNFPLWAKLLILSARLFVAKLSSGKGVIGSRLGVTLLIGRGLVVLTRGLSNLRDGGEGLNVVLNRAKLLGVGLTWFECLNDGLKCPLNKFVSGNLIGFCWMSPMLDFWGNNEGAFDCIWLENNDFFSCLINAESLLWRNSFFSTLKGDKNPERKQFQIEPF